MGLGFESLGEDATNMPRPSLMGPEFESLATLRRTMDYFQAIEPLPIRKDGCDVLLDFEEDPEV